MMSASKIKAELTEDQIEFLNHHDISLSAVFNATGLARKEYKPLMMESGCVVAIGVTKCGYGHSLRTKHGKCIQCYPAVIAFSRRFSQDAFVYVAKSASARLLKIGIAADLTERNTTLREHRYADAVEWTVVLSQKCKNAASIEYVVHKLLSKYAVVTEYWQGYDRHESREVFSCDFEVGRQAFAQATRQGVKKTEDIVTNALVEVFNWQQSEIPLSATTVRRLFRKIQAAASSLPEKEGEIIKRYYGLDDSPSDGLDVIASRLRIPIAETFTLLEQAKRLLRHPAHSANLARST